MTFSPAPATAAPLSAVEFEAAREVVLAAFDAWDTGRLSFDDYHESGPFTVKPVYDSDGDRPPRQVQVWRWIDNQPVFQATFSR